ncbi:MAG: pilus assembly protein PilZ [Peptococcaceae bacterium]|nr:pilus assembly protein PilZ [Peptococcaceae bacterium]
MLYEDKIHEGLSVEVVVREGEYKGRYRTKIEELGKRIISIGVPIADGQFVPLREGTPIEIFFNDELTAYSFESHIIKRIAVPIPTFIIEYPTKIKKVQRRRFVRVQVFKQLKYLVIGKDGVSDEKTGLMNDISGGGVRFQSQENIETKTLMLLKLNLKDTELEIPAKVIRSEKEEDTNTYIISASFQDISERTRDKIIGYVFDIQREMRRKGLI